MVDRFMILGKDSKYVSMGEEEISVLLIQECLTSAEFPSENKRWKSQTKGSDSSLGRPSPWSVRRESEQEGPNQGSGGDTVPGEAGV